MSNRRQPAKWLIGALLLVVLVNCPPIRWVVGFGTDNIYFTQNGAYFEEMPGFGASYEGVKRNYNEYQRLFADHRDTILYRAFKMNPLKFWHWYDYAFHPRYRLPYREYQYNATQHDSLRREWSRRLEALSVNNSK